MSEMVPEGWKKIALGVLSEIIDPHPSHRAPPEKVDGIPFLGIGDLRENGEVITTKGRLVSKDIFFEHNDRYSITQNTIGFGRVASIGKIVDFRRDHKDILISPTLAIIEPINVQKKYLVNFLRSHSIAEQISILTTGSTRSSLGIQLLRELEILVPPLPEQKKIASILTSVDDVIESTQKQIDKLQDLKKATMNELLTKGIGHTEFKDSGLGRIPKSWEVKALGDIGIVVTGSTPSTANRELYGGDYMFVSPADISESMFITGTGKKLTLAGLRKTRRIPENSIMVVCIGSTIGKVAISTQECASNQQINTIVPKLCDPYFLYFAIKWMAHLIRKEAGTQAVPLLNKTDFSNLFAPVPPMNEQREIGATLHGINVEIENLDSKFSHLQSLKKSLMQDLLTGKVRVKVD